MSSYRRHDEFPVRYVHDMSYFVLLIGSEYLRVLNREISSAQAVYKQKTSRNLSIKLTYRGQTDVSFASYTFNILAECIG
jgi:hypothetical protein